MGGGLGVGVAGWVLERLLQADADGAVVRGIVQRAVGFGGEVLDGRHDIDVGRQRALGGFEQAGVVGELQEGGGFSLLGQLTVVGFVRPITQAAGRGDFAEDIGAAEPEAIGEGRLDDDVRCVLHGVVGLLEGSRVTLKRGEVSDRQPVSAELTKIGLFVIEAAGLEDDQMGRAKVRGNDFAARFFLVDGGEVGAV